MDDQIFPEEKLHYTKLAENNPNIEITEIDGVRHDIFRKTKEDKNAYKNSYLDFINFIKSVAD